MAKYPKPNQTGRSKFGKKFVMLEENFLGCSAYRSLSVYSRALYIELKRRYNSRNNGEIHLGIRDAAKAVNCSDKPMRSAFKELQEKGFIRVGRKGGFNVKNRRATEWILTEYEYLGKKPTRDFMRWRPAICEHQ